MGKVVITQDQADRINYFRKDDERKGDAIRYHLNKWLAPVNMCLNELSVDELARALYAGYEVEVEELEPQFEVGDKVFYRTMDTGMHTIIDMQAGICNLRGSVKFTNVKTSSICHATESEIAEEENRLMNVKIKGLLLGLSSGERVRLREKLECGDY